MLSPTVSSYALASVLEIVARRAEKGFGLQARRWVVERTFAWLGIDRRLSKNYETLPASSEAFIYLASCDLITKRLARTNRTPLEKPVSLFQNTL